MRSNNASAGMTAPTAPSSCCDAAAAEISTARIDASCRLPLFTLFGGAALWLVVASVFGLIASLTFHAPKMFADCAAFAYGRALPLSHSALVYGFAIPAGLGVMLWLLARLGRVPLARPWILVVAAKVWHFGVLVGLMGIQAGGGNGFAWLELPHYAAVILLGAFLLIAVGAILTHQARTERALYPSQWFVLAALFWFPWIYSTANLLLLVFPVRGVVQAGIAWWFSGNLLVVWLALTGLAASFYFLPKLSGRPLQSHYLALFVFWTLILFGSWVGIPGGAALPAWMPTLSAAATMLLVVPILAVATSAWLTVRGAKTDFSGGPFCFIRFGVAALVLSGILLAATAIPLVARVTSFTWFGPAQNDLQLYGFFAMTMFGAAYYILPRVAGMASLCPRRVKTHFWFSLLGALLLALPLAVGGVVQGWKLGNPAIPFLDVSKSALMFLRISTLGEGLLVLGSLNFLFNVMALIVRFYFTAGKAAYAEAIAMQPAGVKS